MTSPVPCLEARFASRVGSSLLGHPGCLSGVVRPLTAEGVEIAFGKFSF
jgi:hypothetical protein